MEPTRRPVFILDTDHLSILQHGPAPECERLTERLEQQARSDIYVTITTFHEQVTGWTAYLHRAKDDRGLVRGYLMLQELLDEFSRMNVLPFDAAAAARFRELRRTGVRIGTMDLRIASIALMHGFMVITRNAVDFERVPGLKVEDWTR
jgi:tRNA(fMet)-specific endonuclease VapC